MGDKLDKILFEALETEDSPSPGLNRQIINKAYTIEKKAGRSKRNLAAAAAIALCIALAGGGTAYAAYKYLTSSEIAKNIATNESLEKAFDSDAAIQINESQESGDYVFTLLGLVSGSELNPYLADEEQSKIAEQKTYATVAVSMKDGRDMPNKNFCVSPLIGGVPVEIANNGTMGTFLIWFEQDGIIYELIECDDLEIFADRGVWLSICENFSDETSAYILNEDGSYSVNEEFKGVHVLYKLPLDESKANKAFADEYLKALEKQNNDKKEIDTQEFQSLDHFRASLSQISVDEIEDNFNEVKKHRVTAKPDAEGYIDLTCIDGDITCGISGQLKYFISDTEDFAIVNVFEEDSSQFAFAAIYRNEDGSYTFKEFHQK